ncbi:hypothetical protein H2199_005703 [Coniosporium tulheliwenetii]|uniref:Uncharacterized protein n=1 Tax=Coniosporium tulheliwenetii TaxID=3383036 RepID=A0ACC2Z0D1_9PEZI|nr:hypothetical protein H2199_005703 [Cladosporium sp. JES 115]
MEKATVPFFLDLDYRGHIEGLTLKDKSSGEPLCHYFGGIPYALPPLGPFRWRKPRSLPPCYRYGTRASPGKYTTGAGLCPQPGFGKKLNTEAWDEDCLQCNVWLPAGKAPEKGWPVFFYIHGGFLQFGSPNGMDPSALLSETDCKCILVMPAYRLNVFGFLASRELLQASGHEAYAGNLGFWDQRLALEWTYKNISCFGGDASNITVGGYSAGAHSAFHQLAHELYHSSQRQIIRRVIMWSNGPGLQPKSLQELQDQFDELLQHLHIPLTLPSSEKLARLRSLPVKSLIAATFRMTHHQFRAVTDNSFVHPTLFTDISTGDFGARMRDRGIKLMIDYPVAAVEVLVKHYFPTGALPQGWKDWREAFGRVYADTQIHTLQRGFVAALAAGGAGELVLRYRVEWRAGCVDAVAPRSWGVTHGTDLAGWFWGNGIGAGLTGSEKRVCERGFVGPLARFVRGEEVEWGTRGVKEVRRLRSDGEVDVWVDERWDEGVRVWKDLMDVGSTGASRGAKL